jgi:hypothetical protein
MTTATRETMNERIHKHGCDLLAIFPAATERDPVKLCKKLRRLERLGESIGLRMCNDSTYSSDDADCDCRDVLHDLCSLLGIENGKRLTVFVNRDPRGYALKIQSEDVSRLGLKLHRDWGGYGIIAPDLSAE